MAPAEAMAQLSRAASSVLFASGTALVLFGLSAALGFTLPGIVASVAAVAALLYAGSVWFGKSDDVRMPAVLVFDRHLHIVGGAHAGEEIARRFPLAMREEIQQRCAAALAGQPSHFVCRAGANDRAFDVAPVVSGRPADIAGVLVEGAAVTSLLPDDAAIGVI